MDTNNEKKLLELADKIAITELLNTYADCVDRRDFEGVFECFHPEATFQYQEDGTPLPYKEFYKSMEEVGASYRENMHYIMNVIIKVKKLRFLSNFPGRAAVERCSTADHGPEGQVCWKDINGDKAQAQSYTLAHAWLPPECPHHPPLFPQTGRNYGLLIGARYNDHFEKRQGEWRIIRRKLCYEWDAHIAAPAISGPLANSGTVPSIFE